MQFVIIILFSYIYNNITENISNTETQTKNTQHILSPTLGETSGIRSDKLHRKRGEPIVGIPCDDKVNSSKLKENTEEIIDVRMVDFEKGSQEYNTSKEFVTIDQLETFIKNYQPPNNAENRKIYFYIRDKYLLSITQDTKIHYYSPKIIKKIFDIFASRPEILEHVIIDTELRHLCQLDPDFLAQFRINE